MYLVYKNVEKHFWKEEKYSYEIQKRHETN